MRDKALELVQRLPQGPSFSRFRQTSGGLFRVLVRKAKLRHAHARAAVLIWRDAHPVVETSAVAIKERDRDWSRQAGLANGSGQRSQSRSRKGRFSTM